MHRRNWITLLAACALATAAAPGAHADEVGGSGFSVPSEAPSEWLWGIEGLQRTPIDLSGSIGGSFYGYDFDGVATHVVNPTTAVRRSGGLEVDPSAFEAGFRLSGGLGYWLCCVMIEPAMAFWGNDPGGDFRTGETPRVFDPTNPTEFSQGEIEIKHGWDLAFGPMMTWTIPEDTRYVGRYLGGLPLVFFPYMGVSHSEWEAELSSFVGATSLGTFDRNFEDDSFMIGFDIDFPLPGQIRSLTHAFTVGFRWVDGDENHDMSQAFPGSGDPARRFSFQDIEGWRVGVAYRVTWNDFGGFFRRVIFGPVN